MNDQPPYTGPAPRSVPRTTLSDARARLDRQRDAWLAWRETPVVTRASLAARAGSILRRERERLAHGMTLEMGKPITASLAEVDKCAWLCEWTAEHGPALLAPERVATDASHSEVRFEPLGIVLAIMPWNFPLWQVFRAAVPALVAGNALALKHASNVPGCALAIEALWREAGLPTDVFATHVVSAADAEALVDHPAVAAVTLTGGEPAGRAVAARAGAALKKIVLELGGSDPFVVLADADPVATAHEACLARVVNNGQSCIAAKRFVVEAPVAEAFTEALVEAMRALRVGNPFDPDTQVGPLAREDLVHELEDQVGRSLGAGARLRLGGGRRPGVAPFFEPTVLDRVVPGHAVFDEETFGPVAPVTVAQGESAAIALANHTSFGLGASVWGADPERTARVAARIVAGSVFVNGAVRSDPRLPFGGVRRSGHGRELAAFGLREFVNVKTCWTR